MERDSSVRNLTTGIYRFIRLTARGTRRSSAFLAPPRKGRGNGTGSRGVEFYLFSIGFTTSPLPAAGQPFLPPLLDFLLSLHVGGSDSCRNHSQPDVQFAHVFHPPHRN